jgi:hypothetical protein
LTIEANGDDEIFRIFEEARNNLTKVEAESSLKKKQIVVNLAKEIEGKIPMDTICIEIVNQLRGKVSERFIRECLDEKYKQKTRVNNAKKQMKQAEILAEQPPLNDKQVIFVDAMNGSITQKESDTDDQDDDIENRLSSSDGKNLSKREKTDSTSISLGIGQGREIQITDNQLNSNLEGKCPHCKELKDRNDDLVDALQKLNQYANADNLIRSKGKYDGESPVTILPFELHWSFKEIREYMAPLFPKGGDPQQVWFNGKIDVETGKIVSSGFGKISE